MSQVKRKKFDLYLQHDLLLRSARETLRSAIEASQVSQRMKRLLPSVRLDRKRHYLSNKFSSAKSDRLSLLDEEYLDFIENFIEARASAMRDRVMADSYFRLIGARQSLRPLRIREQQAGRNQQ